jgi:hypothetical protein
MLDAIFSIHVFTTKGKDLLVTLLVFDITHTLALKHAFQ